MEALIIANRNYSSSQRNLLKKFIKKVKLIATCNLGFIYFSESLKGRHFLTKFINVSADLEIIEFLDELNIDKIDSQTIKLYHSEYNLDTYRPIKSHKCPISSWWDSGTHAIAVVIMEYPFIQTINCFGFGDGSHPNFYFKKSRSDLIKVLPQVYKNEITTKLNIIKIP